MDKTIIFFAVVGILIVFFLWQWLFPGLYKKVFPNFNITFGPIDLVGNSKNDGKNSDSPEENSGSSATTTTNEQPNYSGPRPDTIITFGPAEGAKITKETEVTFRFAYTWSGDSDGTVFETKMSGVDNDWVANDSGERKISLLPGNQSYSFQVRAKTKDGIVDLSPATRNFIGLLSKYLGQVEITSASSGTFGGSVMTVSLRNNGNDSINMTGWKINGSYGASAIGQAVAVYTQSGGASQNRDLILEKNGSITIFGDSSPLGVNFRINKCMGYLTGIYNFYYGFSTDCPRPENSELRGFTPACYDYLSSLGSCEVPNPDKLNSFAGDSACRYFADSRLNYNGCFSAYRQTADFFSNEWHVFSGRNFVGDRYDTLDLFDSVGLFVGRYSY